MEKPINAMHIALKQETGNKIHNIYLYDDITACPSINWATCEIRESETSAEHIRDQLNTIPAYDPINVYINSCGGDVTEGTAIYNMLKRHPGPTTGYVDGVAHSIAFTILQACKRRVYGDGTSSIIHNMWIDVCGNANDLRKAADDLDAFMDSCVALYMSRAKGLTEQQLRKMLDESTVLTPDLALQYGFADSVGEIPDNPEGMDPEAQKDKPDDQGDEEHDDEPEDPDDITEQHTDPDPKQNDEPQINKGIGFNAFFDSAD